MKKKLFCVATMVACCASVAIGQVPFEQTSGPGETQIWSFAKGAGNLVLAATSNKVFHSTDHGANWAASGGQFDFHAKTVLAFESNGTTAYAADGSKVYISTDGGLSWNPTTAQPAASSLFAVAVTASNHILVGTYNSGVARSTDQGTSWSSVATGLPTEPGVNDLYPVLRLVAAPNGSIFAMTDGGIARSTDEGGSWTTPGGLTLPLSVSGMAASKSGALFAASQDALTPGLFESNDNGDTWTNLAHTRGLNISSSSNVATDDGTAVLVSAGQGLWLSRDGGVSWSSVRGATADEDQVLCISGNADYFYDGMAHNGVFVSHDKGGTWKPASKGMIPFAVQAMASDSSGNIYAVSDTAGLYKSSDHGDTWIQRDTGILSNNITSITATPTGELYATAFGTGVYHSTDQGANWTNITDGPNIIGINKTLSTSSCVKPDGTVFFGGYNGTIYRTINNGTSWKITRKGIPLDTIKFLLVNASGTVFAVNASGIFYTNSNGDQWDTSLTSPTNALAVAAHPNGWVYASNANGIYYTTDNGISWQTLTTAVQGATGLVAASPGTAIYAATPTKLYYSPDAVSWQTLSTPFASAPMFMTEDSKTKVLYAGTRSTGLYRGDQGPNASVRPSRSVAASAAIEDNYPNPFSSSTTLRYTVSTASYVKIDLIDMSGKECATLFDGYQAAGEQHIVIDARTLRLGEGVYQCRLECNGMSTSKSIVHYSF